MSELLEIGNTVVVENAFGKRKYEITRVTKTSEKLYGRFSCSYKKSNSSE